MWLLVFIFFLLTFILGWTLFGYVILIWFLGLFRKRKKPKFPDKWPMISVIVPCYNEERYIIDKLADIRQVDYPHECLEVVFVDGGSSDATVSLLKSKIKDCEPYRVVVAPSRGKVNQINYILPQLRGDIIVNTDTDSRLKKDALKWIAAEFAEAPDIYVVGAYCRPSNEAIDIEKYYWDTQNKWRLMETDARSSSIVIAQCYAFRRQLLDRFPDDVVADDIYVGFLANAMRYRTTYSRYAMATETRVPKTYSEFFSHKFRKSNAFLRETLRFLYRLPEMGDFCKMMFITRIAQQLLLPITFFSWLLIAGVLLTLFRFDVVIFGILFLVCLLGITNRIFASVKLPVREKRHSLAVIIRVYLFTNFILFATGVSYLFFHQGSAYARIGKER